MIITIDRFEGELAVIELPDGNIINAPKELFYDACEGDKFEIDKIKEKTTEELINKLFK